MDAKYIPIWVIILLGLSLWQILSGIMRLMSVGLSLEQALYLCLTFFLVAFLLIAVVVNTYRALLALPWFSKDQT